MNVSSSEISELISYLFSITLLLLISSFCDPSIDKLIEKYKGMRYKYSILNPNDFTVSFLRITLKFIFVYVPIIDAFVYLYFLLHLLLFKKWLIFGCCILAIIYLGLILKHIYKSKKNE